VRIYACPDVATTPEVLHSTVQKTLKTSGADHASEMRHNDKEHERGRRDIDVSAHGPVMRSRGNGPPPATYPTRATKLLADPVGGFEQDSNGASEIWQPLNPPQEPLPPPTSNFPNAIAVQRWSSLAYTMAAGDLWCRRAQRKYRRAKLTSARLILFRHHIGFPLPT
jgi:hypothetical protein